MSDETTDGDGGPVAYKQDDYVVICDRENPNAWISSDTVVSEEDLKCDQISPV